MRGAGYRLRTVLRQVRPNIVMAVVAGAVAVAGMLSLASVPALAADKAVALTAVVVSNSDRQTKAYEAAFKLYEKAHPGVTISVTPIGDPLIWQDKVLAMTVGGTPPDIMWLWGINFRNLASTGPLLPLDKYVTPDFLQAYYPNAIEASRYEGKLYAL
ncbi:MAG: extracellular solute-binding protein, partial [Bacteroidota bacterium]